LDFHILLARVKIFYRSWLISSQNATNNFSPYYFHNLMKAHIRACCKKEDQSKSFIGGHKPQTMDIVDLAIHGVVFQKSDFHGNSDI
jgi:hypothetical protein